MGPGLEAEVAGLVECLLSADLSPQAAKRAVMRLIGQTQLEEHQVFEQILMGVTRNMQRFRADELGVMRVVVEHLRVRRQKIEKMIEDNSAVIMEGH